MHQYLEHLKQNDIVRYMYLNSIKNNIHKEKIICITQFDEELTRIPFLVNEPMAGFIRLAWWRENLLSNKLKGNPKGEEGLIFKLCNILEEAKDEHIFCKAFEDLINSIEIILDKQRLNSEEELFNKYIRLVASAHARIICNITTIPYNDSIDNLFSAYSVINFIRSINIYKKYGWDLELYQANIITLLKMADHFIQRIDKEIIKIPPFRVIYIATKFYINHYLRHILSNENKIYEPNLGVLRLKLALGLLYLRFLPSFIGTVN